MKKFLLLVLAGFLFVAVSMAQGYGTFSAQTLTNGDTITTEAAKVRANTFFGVNFKITNASVTSAGDTIYVLAQAQVSPVDPSVNSNYWADYGDQDTLFIPTDKTSRLVTKSLEFSSGLNWPWVRYYIIQKDTVTNTLEGKYYFINKSR